MKQKEITLLEDAELRERLGEFKLKYTKLKMTHAVTPLENPSQLRLIRRDIARLATEVSKRQKQ